MRIRVVATCILLVAILRCEEAYADILLPVIGLNEPFSGTLTIIPPAIPITPNGPQPYWGQFPTPADFGSISVLIGGQATFSAQIGFLSPSTVYEAQGFPVALNGVMIPDFSISPNYDGYGSIGVNFINVITSGVFPGRFVLGDFNLTYPTTSYENIFVGGQLLTFGLTSSSPNQETFAFSGNIDSKIVSDVPEPSTWAMLLIGFAAIGFAGYRKSRRETFIAKTQLRWQP